MKFFSKRALLFLVFLLAFLSESKATHLRAGEITAVRVNCSGRTYRITVTVYIDMESHILFGGQNEILYFGDSTWVEVPETQTTPRPDLGTNMGMASFTIDHTYSGPGRFLIRYAEPFRNGDVVNLDNPLNTMFYIETSITIDPFIGCDNSPLLLVPPIDKACTGAAWFHNPGAYDLDGDSLSYQLVVPYQEKSTPVANYRLPDTKEFYDKAGLHYSTANEDGTGPPDFTIDPTSGTITWDAPGGQGEYNIAFLIKQWRKINGVWLLLGYVERDMQIVVEDCDNKRPELIVPEDICVEAGTEINQDIFAFDPDSDSVKVEAFSEVFILNPLPAAMLDYAAWQAGTFYVIGARVTSAGSSWESLTNHADAVPPVQGPIWKKIQGTGKHKASSPTNPARWVFHWKTDCAHIKDQPYQVVFKVTDKPLKGPKLIDFKTWNIRVVGPAPVWEDISLDVATRSATVKWDPYACASAEKMEVWRRVDQFPFTPPECVTGIPEYLGYLKVAEVPIDKNNYRDTNLGAGLAVGAQYCYRLVAVFKQPGGGESYVSKDTCLAPIVADAPVITNVSVVRTSLDLGQIEVKWRSAFDVSKIQFPPPYKFEVYRAEGVVGNTKITLVGTTKDSTIVDAGTVTNPLNTEDQIYNYRIVQYDNNNAKVDTSATASSVRVEATPEVKKIELNWAAVVPWSNRTDTHPYHLIFRGKPTDAQLTLIDSVNVNEAGFTYTDEGKYMNIPLKETDTYCYRIETRGSYGNPGIAEPLKNFSQIICAQPNDTVPPCPPVLNTVAATCEEQAQQSTCGLGPFRNVLTWNQPLEECRADIRSYNIYIADHIGGEFSPYRENVRDTFFIDTNENLRSFARCYKVTSVDRSQNESDLEEAEEFCFDNCPYYELPNVFTPNGDNCNEFFSAFGDPVQMDACGMIDISKCARFVESVDIIVFDRWGVEVYRKHNAREDQIYIRWNGTDNEGKEVASGVYYYKATVHFITVDPSNEEVEMKGWVQLIRG